MPNPEFTSAFGRTGDMAAPAAGLAPVENDPEAEIRPSAPLTRRDDFARKAMLPTRSIRALSCCAQNGG